MKTPYVAQSTAAALPCQADSLQGSFGSRRAMWREALSLAIAFSIGLAIGLLNENFPNASADVAVSGEPKQVWF